jgi:hypothetical protein
MYISYMHLDVHLSCRTTTMYEGKRALEHFLAHFV